MAEILLDPTIRFWVFLPIVLINFFIGIVRHYFTVLMNNDKKPDLDMASDGQILNRSRLLRENGNCLPKAGFLMRKYYLNDDEKGFFKTTKRANKASNMFDQGIMTDMMKGQMMNVLPMMLIGTWINYAFSGFLTTRVPFPLTFRFKPLLQRGMESLVSLEASWVSSASWYFLNFFGLRSMYSLLLGSDNQADQARAMQDAFVGGFGGQPGAQPPDMEKLFKTEWETLELVHHKFAFAQADEEFANRVSEDFSALPPSPKSTTSGPQNGSPPSSASQSQRKRKP